MNQNQTAKKNSAKKIIAVISVLLVLVAVAAVAANLNTIKAWLSPSDTVSYTLTVNVGEQTVKQLEIKTETTKSLLSAMENEPELKIEQTDGFITSICGHCQSVEANEYWTYTVNDEMLMVGAADYYPSDNDSIVFTLGTMTF